MEIEEADKGEQNWREQKQREGFPPPKAKPKREGEGSSIHETAKLPRAYSRK